MTCQTTVGAILVDSHASVAMAALSVGVMYKKPNARE